MHHNSVHHRSLYHTLIYGIITPHNAAPHVNTPQITLPHDYTTYWWFTHHYTTSHCTSYHYTIKSYKIAPHISVHHCSGDCKVVKGCACDDACQGPKTVSWLHSTIQFSLQPTTYPVKCELYTVHYIIYNTKSRDVRGGRRGVVRKDNSGPTCPTEWSLYILTAQYL